MSENGNEMGETCMLFGMDQDEFHDALKEYFKAKEKHKDYYELAKTLGLHVGGKPAVFAYILAKENTAASILGECGPLGAIVLDILKGKAEVGGMNVIKRKRDDDDENELGFDFF